MLATNRKSTNQRDGHGTDGKFLPGNKCSPGNPLGRNIEQFRAVLLQTSRERFPELIAKLYHLAIEEGKQWVCELLVERVLGKQREATEPTRWNVPDADARHPMWGSSLNEGFAHRES